VDLPGFGHSQRSESLLSPRAMGEFIITVADAFGLKHPHVVAPGPGTPAALFAAAQHPGCLRSLVAGSSAAAVPLQLGGIVKEIVEASGLEEFRRADPRQLVNTALSGISRYTLPEAVRDDYLASYQGDRFAESARYLRSYPAELPALASLLPKIATPVQIIAGAADTATPPVNASFLHERLPHSKLDVLNAGHFTWEDAAAEYAALIISWWRGTASSTANGSRK
jgi:pimeloyl-ACP methyl ester carboxylesterase